MGKKIFLASPRGFCAGVKRALEIVEKAVAFFAPPVYVFHEIVHNDIVVENLKRKGVVFVEDLAGVPPSSPVIFSAHGVSLAVEASARSAGLKIIDATCPLVKKIHKKAESAVKSGSFVFLIGHKKHPEISGTFGHLNAEKAIVIEKESDINDSLREKAGNSSPIYLTQTTLCPHDTDKIIGGLKKIFPSLKGGGDICYATVNRQNAVKMVASKADTVFIIGSQKSSNSNRLRELAEKCGPRSFLINSASEITGDMLAGAQNIGVSAGASAPEKLAHDLIQFLYNKGWTALEEISCAREETEFSIPDFSNHSE